MKTIKPVAFAPVLLLMATQAWSQSLACERSYAFRADVNTTQGTTLCSSKANDFIDRVKDFGFSNASYTVTSPAQIQAKFSDVNIQFGYARNSNTFTYNFIEIGESGSFTGTTRSDAQNQFIDYVKKNDILGKLMKYQSQHSATSPITGAGGLIPMNGAADFANSFDTTSKIGSSLGDGGSSNLIGIGLNFGSYSPAGSADKVTTTTLPLSYTIRNDIDPRRQLVFSMPLTRVTVGDANGYQAGFGVAYRYPLSDNWTVTPGARYAIIASKDRATVSTVMSASLMSTYVIPGDGYDVAIGNMIGYYKTGKFSNADYSFNPNIGLTMTRNGVMVALPTTAFGSKMSTEVTLVDTRYLGEKPFVDNTQELGITLGTNKNATNARTFTRVGATLLRGKDIRGFTLNLGYWF